MDVVSSATRSRMMSGIRGKDTRPELIIRKRLHREGFRYRLHEKDLPGKPDLVFPKYKALIFVNGCFWHGHNCHLFTWPKSRVEFWRKKIIENKRRDEMIIKHYSETEWRVMIIWECALKGKCKLSLDGMINDIAIWLRSSVPGYEISGLPQCSRTTSST